MNGIVDCSKPSLRAWENASWESQRDSRKAESTDLGLNSAFSIHYLYVIWQVFSCSEYQFILLKR